jgi:L-methionine (R)-S-oxide reductase
MKLDAQSLQNLLAAAFTIQEFNGRNLAEVAESANIEEVLSHVPNPYTEYLEAAEPGEPEATVVKEKAESKVADAEEQVDPHLSPQVSSHLLRRIAEQALQVTNATSAAIAFKEQGHLTCLEAVGDSPSTITATINAGSGFAGLCASSGTVQFCTNTILDPRPDADSCRKIGIRAVIVVPLFHQHRLLGLISVFSRKPYAFGERGLQALLRLVQEFDASLKADVEPASAGNDPPSQ